ncbi:thioredoxin reductase, partial [mine drainage metagenome]
ALDWTLELAGKAASLTLVHRRAEFRAAPASVAKMRALTSAGKVRHYEALPHSLRVTQGRLDRGMREAARWGDRDARSRAVLVFFGLHPKLGPIADWGIELEKRALRVDTEKFQTSVPGVFAVGDINAYPGKKKLILSGFHEAALAAYGIQHHLNPQKRQFLQYTTTSPIMHQ